MDCITVPDNRIISFVAGFVVCLVVIVLGYGVVVFTSDS